jgi:subtilisin family serine protease
VAPALAAELSALAPGTQVPIIVTLTHSADLAALNAEALRQGLDRRERAAFVIPALKAAAEAGQAPLRTDLALWEATKQVSHVRSFWIMDGLALSATEEVVRALAVRSGVSEIAFDGQLELDRPFDEGPASAAPGQAETGLRVVNAPALWAQGITGAGVTVMNIDTGVSGGHAALASRWLGTVPGVAAADAWFDPIQQSCSTPCDYGSHGTHTMGIMTGLDPATQDTVGVAFGAHWIAAATLGASPHTSYSIAAFQWALDPGPAATRGPADVISCSWQDPSLSVAQDCGPNGTYWAAVDGFEAAGGAVVWSAGNAGSGAQSITRPKNRISSPVNHFATGNINGNNASFPISSSSSRGPSRCDGLTIKPEAVAPGTDVRSSTPAGYASMSGTSMASPHAAGVIALLLDAFPWATGTDAKLAIIATARDLGTPGEDNTYGNGLIDAGAAYQFLSGAAALHEADGAPEVGISLGEAAPNPFHPATSLAYDLKAESVVTLKVYDHNGRAVATVTDQATLGAGRHHGSWNGRTATGERAASGMYFFRLMARPAADAAAMPIVLERRAILLK